MANGVLGKVDLSASTLTDVYAPTAGLTGSVSVNFCNRNQSPVTVRLAIANTSATPADTEWLIYNTVIPGYSSLERTGLAVKDDFVVAYSSQANVAVMAYGYEE